MILGYIRIGLATLAVLGFLTLFHLYMASSLPGSEIARFLYTLPAGPPKKGAEWPAVDFFLPVVVFSAAIGYSFPVKCPWGQKAAHILISAAVCAALLVGIIPMFVKLHLFPPPPFSGPSENLTPDLFKDFIGTLVFLTGGSLGVWLA